MLRFYCAAALCLALLPVPAAIAADPIVSVAPTPAPKAGPTVAAAEEFCGDPTGKAEDLIQRYTTKPGLKQVYKSDQYVAYSDDEKASTVMYTFTAKAHPAYPAAVCRKPVRDGNFMTIKMSVVCDGAADACEKLKNDFNVMTAKMQVNVNEQITDQKK